MLLATSVAFGQCAEGEFVVEWSIGGGSWDSEISWQLNDADGNNLFNGLAPEAGIWCLPEGDYTFIGSDSYGDGWNGALLTYTVNGQTSTWSLDSGLSDSFTISASNDVPGCTDSTASNYNPDATVDDESCCFESIVTVTLSDSFGDGWGSLSGFGGWILNGDSVALTGSGFVPGGISTSFDLCLPAGCYEAEIQVASWGLEASWSVADAAGNIINSGVGTPGGTGPYSETFQFYAPDADGAPDCVVLGCTAEDACNYDPLATFDDATCEYLTCAGCTDSGACNYDEESTFDDGSCDYSCVGCQDETANNYDAESTIACTDCCLYCELAILTLVMEDSWGDGWNANTLTIGDETYCFPDAFGDCESTNIFTQYSNELSFQLCIDTTECTTVTYNADGSFQSENSWLILDSEGNTLADFGAEDGYFGSCDFGCTDAAACNYDLEADIDDASCDYSCIGCQDSSAANYDPNATLPGPCVYCDPGTFILTVDMTDSFGDGWNSAEYYLYNLSSGALEDSGSLQTAFTGDGLTVGTDFICLAPGCYNFQVTDDQEFNPEVGITLTDQFGTSYASLGDDITYELDFTLTGQCGFEGCTDPMGLNYDPSASVDDGSCQLPPANNDVEGAEAIACGLSLSGTLQYATDNEGLAGSIFEQDALGASAVWYVINSDADQQITVSTCDTPQNVFGEETDYVTDTDIAIFTQDMDGALTCIANNGEACVSGLHSSISFGAAVGMDYYIRVEGGAGSDFVVSATCDASVTPPSNDDCESAQAITLGETLTSSLCGANSEMQLIVADGSSMYGVYFTFNTADYDAYAFQVTNVSNEFEFGGLGALIATAGDCEEGLGGWFGCVGFTGQCGDGTNPVAVDEPNSDIYLLIYTDEIAGCGEFDFIVNGLYFGCTDAAASNYDATANSDDGSCDYTDVTPENDSCAGAIELECNTTVVGSTGGATAMGAPNGVTGCPTAAGPGVWYTFVGDSSYHTISTCGSTIDSKVSIYSADTLCGGSSMEVPPVDACDSLVTVDWSIGGGSWDSEISWSLIAADSSVAQSGLAGAGSFCLPEGDYTLEMYDSYGDGWNGASAAFSDALGNSLGFGTLTEGAFGTADVSVSAYSMDPIVVAGEFDCVASADSDENGICDFFDSDDVSFEFISEPGVLYYVYVGSNAVPGAFNLSFDCAPVVEGCSDQAACNYNADANVDGGCDYFSCLCADDAGVPVEFYMVDSFGDGWDGAEYTITDLSGDVVASGSLDEATIFVDDNNIQGNDFGSDFFCLDPACYQITVTGGIFPFEVSWQLLTADGTVLAAGGPNEGDPATAALGDSVCGCTEDGACNYDADATDNDGSCEYDSCAGCTDNTACNYDADALIEDGSCCFDNCVSINMEDSFGDGWNGYVYTLTTVGGEFIGSGTIEFGSSGLDSYCLADGCYVIEVSGGAFAFEVSWSVSGAFAGLVEGGADEAVTFNVGSGDQCVEDCDIPSACNYNPDTNLGNVELCVFDGCSGCTYATATNYDEGSVIDDGSCNFEIANPCPADLNGDGSVSTADLLEFLTAFGQEC